MNKKLVLLTPIFMLLPLCAMQKKLKRVDRCYNVSALADKPEKQSIKSNLIGLINKLKLKIRTYKDEEIEAGLIPVHSPIED